MVPRRSLLRGTVGATLASIALVRPGAARATNAAPVALRDIAAQRGLLFGAEIESADIEEDAPYRRFFASQCAILVPGREAKWDATEPARGVFEFTPLDRIVAYAAANRIAVRLHTLVWGLAMPPWLKPALLEGDRADAAGLLARHVGEVVGRFRGRVLAWDVANEVTDPLWRRGPEGLTLTPWRRALGPECIPLAFALTREADPQAKLFLNDDGLEYRGARFDEKRATLLRLLEGWRRAGVPIDGFGVQSHLDPSLPLDLESYRRFLGDLAAMGLQIHLTELDVRDRALPAPIAVRDGLVASLAGHVLAAALDERAVSAVLTWGLSDRRTYQDTDPAFRREDGLPSRGLPFDAALRPTPMRDAIAAALARAPKRGRALAGEDG